MSAGGWESYLYPGTNVLRNRPGLRDQAALDVFEYGQTARRERQIESGQSTIQRTYDAAHLRSLHWYLFQDVYDWAGQYRTVDLAKGKSQFADAGQIDQHLGMAAAAARRADWPAATRAEFVDAMSHIYAPANQAHPFREGSGRSTKLWLSHIAERSPFALDYSRISPREWNLAAGRSWVPGVGARSSTMFPIFDAITVDRPSSGQAPAATQAQNLQRVAYPGPARPQGPQGQGSQPQSRPTGYGPSGPQRGPSR